MKLSEVTLRTDNISRTYTAGLADCASIAEVRDYLEGWKEIAADAVTQAKTITDADWKWALRNKKRDKHAERVYALAGDIFLPSLLVSSVMLARQYRVTEGTALIRTMELRRGGRPR